MYFCFFLLTEHLIPMTRLLQHSSKRSGVSHWSPTSTRRRLRINVYHIFTRLPGNRFQLIYRNPLIMICCIVELSFLLLVFSLFWFSFSLLILIAGTSHCLTSFLLLGLFPPAGAMPVGLYMLDDVDDWPRKMFGSTWLNGEIISTLFLPTLPLKEGCFLCLSLSLLFLSFAIIFQTNFSKWRLAMLTWRDRIRNWHGRPQLTSADLKIKGQSELTEDFLVRMTLRRKIPIRLLCRLKKIAYVKLNSFHEVKQSWGQCCIALKENDRNVFKHLRQTISQS